MEELKTSSLFTAIVGRPNVGKSSLLNRLVGEKVAIVTPKPQTTRTRITGVITKGLVQYVFLDTPGMHRPRTLLGERMARTVRDTVQDGDAVLMLFEPEAELNDVERELIEGIKVGGAPAIAVINKADIVKNKAKIEEKRIEVLAFAVFKQVQVISAISGEGCDELLNILAPFAVEGPHFFSEDDYTDMPEKQLVSEVVREKLLIHMQEEIPHGTAVEVERFHEREDKPMIDIDVVIYCERKSHKGMIIGKSGQMLKKIATDARKECEQMLNTKINLKCWVKVKNDWRDNDFLLNNFGFKK